MPAISKPESPLESSMPSSSAQRSRVSCSPAFTDLSWIRRWWYLLLVLAVMWAPVLTGLLDDWNRNPNYSHGFLIPFAVVYFLWVKREVLREAVQAPATTGLALIGLAIPVYLVGLLGAEFFMQRCSMLLFAAGMVAFFWGWRCLRETSFVFTLAFLAIPLPAIVFNAIAFPLQLIASAWAAGLLRLVGIPVFQQGNILQLPQQVLNVAEACSGIRSLISLMTLALMVAWFLPVRRWVQAGLVAAAIPVALIANALRIALTGILGKYLGPEYSEGFFHLFSGWLIFLVAFVLLLGLASVVSRIRVFRRGAPA
jgi:exosortase